MMNFTAGVAQPSQNPSGNVETAFQDAVARAKEIAARLQPSDSLTQGLKRPYEESPDQFFPGPDPKKIAAINDPIGAQLKAMSDPSMNAAQAQMQARSVADQINSKLLGQSMGGSPPMSQMAPQGGGLSALGVPGLGNNGSAMGGGTITEEMQIPNKVVGLVIGKGGEMINRLQSDSGCRIQVAPDPMLPVSERSITLSGTPQQVEIAKTLVTQVVETGMTSTNHTMPNEGETYTELMIPASKVGLIIGKRGETIKSLIERSGARMTMIQDGPYAHAMEKPLRIFGDPQCVQHGKKLVMDLIAERENDGYGRGPRGGGGGGGHYGSEYGGDYGGPRGGQTVNQVEVPRDAVGHVIGRGGETIKSIQTETGAKVQFQPDEPGKPVRMCTVSGTPDKVATAVQRIDEIINEKMQRDGPGGGGRGGGGGGFGGGHRDMGEPVTQLAVPADKCGLVIGKGGDTIRQINTMTGAHVELQRNTRPDAPQKYFGIKGTPQQVQQAIMKICEKAGINPPEPNAPNGMGPGGHHGGPHGGPPMGGYGGYGQPSPAPHPASTSYPGHTPQGWGQPISHWEQPAQSPQQAPAPTGGQQSSTEQDYTQQWADYYRMIGRPDYADVVLASRTNQPGAGQSAAPAGGAAPQSAPQAPQHQQYGGAPGGAYGQQAQAGAYGQQSYGYPGYGS